MGLAAHSQAGALGCVGGTRVRPSTGCRGAPQLCRPRKGGAQVGDSLAFLVKRGGAREEGDSWTMNVCLLRAGYVPSPSEGAHCLLRVFSQLVPTLLPARPAPAPVRPYPPSSPHLASLCASVPCPPFPRCFSFPPPSQRPQPRPASTHQLARSSHLELPLGAFSSVSEPRWPSPAPPSPPSAPCSPAELRDLHLPSQLPLTPQSPTGDEGKPKQRAPWPSHHL